MRIFTEFSRWIVGLLFIFSGLIKLNDPYGFSYKLQEYFEVFSKDFGPVFHSFIPFALSLSILICVLEIVLGVAVLLYFKMKWTTWILLLMIIFFTFLTFYSAYFDKVKECGCFGDFISLTPWQSFWKDIILLILILVLFVKRNKLNGAFNNLSGNIIVGVSAVICFYLAYYSLNHLPFVDFRPYKVGKNIQEQMKPEEDPKFIYIMKKGDKEYEFEAYPTDTSYKYVSYRVLNPEKSQPKIMDYQIWNDEGDFTDSSLTGKKLLIVVKDAEKALTDSDARENATKVSQMLINLKDSEIKPMVLTASQTEDIEAFRHEVQLAAPYFYMDDIQLKTMIRANVGLLLLDNGTIKGKWHHNDVPSIDKIKNLVN